MVQVPAVHSRVVLTSADSSQSRLMPQGTLFTEDFLNEGIRGTEAWRSLVPDAVASFRGLLRGIFAKIADPARLNESQTEERIVKPILEALGWEGCFWVQERLETKGRANVPDYLLFGSAESAAAADRQTKAAQRYPLAIAVGDAKAWSIGLDRRGSGAGMDETPSGQILRYLSRAEVQSERKVQWGVLTNGRHWRLYYQGAKSRLEEYFEIDIAWLLSLKGIQGDLDATSRPAAFASDQAWSDHLLTVFWLMFRREAFLPGVDGRTFHQVALAEAREWESKVRESLADVVFGKVFPDLMRAMVRADGNAPQPLDAAYLATVREAALTMLYRLLFALYAEDRDLLPKRDPNYGGLSRLRDEIAARVDKGTVLSGRRKNYSGECAELFITIDEGDDTLGVPPYNGGLFSDRTPATDLLERAALPDADFAPLLDGLARTEKDGRRVRINFRDLSVQQLGSIYERLLEYEPVPDPAAKDGIGIRLNSFARKGSGSYYTPQELVGLIIARTVGPLVDEKIAAFEDRAAKLARDKRRPDVKLEELREADPANAILSLKIVDPAMGSGHFLVSLVDYLAERVIAAMIEAREAVEWGEYASPLAARLAAIRDRILSEAKAHGWTVREEHLVDKNLVKRFVLKRCVYGVDKNPMAVELAKVALWLHTFTAGAPLSFLNHHLKCGDSLFGEWVRKALDELAARGALLISDAIKQAEGAIAGMQFVENLTDAEIAEVKASANAYHEVETRTEPLRRFLDFWQAVKWLDLSQEEKKALQALLDGIFGQPFPVAAGLSPPIAPTGYQNGDAGLFGAEAPQQLAMAGTGVASVPDYLAVRGLLAKAHALAAEQRFLHWQIAFPGVWKNWVSAEPVGGFDAVIGNPPWDRMKMQEVEWFAARAPQVARQARAADRKTLIAEMKEAGDPLIAQYERASALAETAMERARRDGNYPLLSRGDINIYSLFVERAQALIKADGVAGLLVPSGIASDLGASAFFRKVATSGRVQCLFDFENRRGDRREPFFPDVDSRFKFCVFVCGGSKRTVAATECAFFLRDPPQQVPDENRFVLTSTDFLLVNPNTGTAPIFRARRDAEVTTAIYRRLPVLVDRSNGTEKKAWPLRYLRMFDMTNDSHLFWTQERLGKEGAYPAGMGHWRKGEQEWIPLYEGKMVQAFDHRAADVVINPDNVHRPAQQEALDEVQHADPDRLPASQFWVNLAEAESTKGLGWVLGFKEITSPTNFRTMIASIMPAVAFGNKTPLLIPEVKTNRQEWLLAADLNSFAHDYVARQKLHGQTLNLFLVEQFPVLTSELYQHRFGPRTAADIVKDHVLRLTYTAHDMAPFARDMGYVNKNGTVKPPIIWNESERRHLRARLDALYFILYGVTDEDDIRYILSTFPIVERKDREAFEGVYLTRELILWYKRALEAGDPDALAPEAEVIRLAKAHRD
jgi:hypothetical protein